MTMISHQVGYINGIKRDSSNSWDTPSGYLTVCYGTWRICRSFMKIYEPIYNDVFP